MTVHLPETIPDTTYLYGYALLIGTIFVFVMSGYSIIGSKYMPDTNNKSGTNRFMSLDFGLD
ncbi:hypothetical protein MBANPS3_004243 [Mucor bainieri]